MAASAGTFANTATVAGLVAGYSSAATTAAQFLTEIQLPFACLIKGIQGHGTTAGTGAGSTVLDILVNGTSIWSTAADRPTLLAVSTGAFAIANRPGAIALKRGDILSLQVASISSTGHARLKLTVGLARTRSA